MVVGGEVVVVVGGEVVVVVGDVDPELALVEVDEVAGEVVVVVVDVVAGTSVGVVVEDALAPGCSLDTTTPIAMAAPVAITAAARVSRRRRASARRLVSGELRGGVELTARFLGSAWSHRTRDAYPPAESFLWIAYEVSTGSRTPSQPTEGGLRQHDG